MTPTCKMIIITANFKPLHILEAKNSQVYFFICLSFVDTLKEQSTRILCNRIKSYVPCPHLYSFGFDTDLASKLAVETQRALHHRTTHFNCYCNHHNFYYNHEKTIWSRNSDYWMFSFLLCLYRYNLRKKVKWKPLKLGKCHCWGGFKCPQYIMLLPLFSS